MTHHYPHSNDNRNHYHETQPLPASYPEGYEHDAGYPERSNHSGYQVAVDHGEYSGFSPAVVRVAMITFLALVLGAIGAGAYHYKDQIIDKSSIDKYLGEEENKVDEDHSPLVDENDKQELKNKIQQERDKVNDKESPRDAAERLKNQKQQDAEEEIRNRREKEQKNLENKVREQGEREGNKLKENAPDVKWNSNPLSPS